MEQVTRCYVGATMMDDYDLGSIVGFAVASLTYLVTQWLSHEPMEPLEYIIAAIIFAVAVSFLSWRYH